MAKDTAVATASNPRELALLQAVGFDKLSPAQRELALHISDRYELDPMLKHLVMIEGRAYITRDGLLHVAHRSGQLDGIETTEPEVRDGFWRCTASVYRKDMSRPFTYGGRYPTQGGNQKFAPEMAVKVAEVMALRRAFDIAAPTAEERWDVDAESVPSRSAAAPSLAERAAAKAAEITVDADAERAAAQGSGLSRDAFLAALQGSGISPAQALEKARERYGPSVDPKLLTDEQRWDLVVALTKPDEAPSLPLFDAGEDAELDAAVGAQ